MSIGYACLAVGVPYTDYKTCRLKNVSVEKLEELIKYNLSSLEYIIDYNIKNDIKLFRISSDLIPFGSSSVNTLPWWELFAYEFKRISEKIDTSGMRVSMHPGQYTVLNSPDQEVVKKAIGDLNYHSRVLDTLGLKEKHKIVLHIGGVYNDKKQAVKRFITHYQELDRSIKDRLIIENDDKSYTIEEVLEIGTAINVPVVFDNLHHAINHVDHQKDDMYWIRVCKRTWQIKDGLQKIHYSQQAQNKKLGSHAEGIKLKLFMAFYEKLQQEKLDVDIMLEVKDKNLSAVKCINATTSHKKIKALELEWRKYKYSVLERSHSDYLEIRKLFRGEETYPVRLFYHHLEEALAKEYTKGSVINGALHVWGYFKDVATQKEKERFFNLMEAYKEEKVSLKMLKGVLWKLAIKYERAYLLDSYYFVI